MDPIPIHNSKGESKFESRHGTADLKLLDFWSRAFSDVLTNTTRGILAEFIVASALGINREAPRNAWAKYDLDYKGSGIEVKSAAYHQRWRQNKLSAINFHVPKTKGWDEATNKLEVEAKRQAGVYVLCLLAEKERDIVNPLNLDQWEFWVISSTFLNDRARSQTSITLNSLLKEIGQPIGYRDIKPRVEAAITRNRTS